MTKALAQPGILRATPKLGRYLLWQVHDAAQLPQALQALARWNDPANANADAVVGLGQPLVRALGGKVPGLHKLAAVRAEGARVPATPMALCCWLRASDGDLGDLVNRTQALQTLLEPAFKLHTVLDGFRHSKGPNGFGRDLSGYEDGTANPEGAEATAAALVRDQGPGLDGSSFMALQQWQHRMQAVQALRGPKLDSVIGRRQKDNVELKHAPRSAHVKRTTQEDFSPEAFVLRRSMPWAQGNQCGLMFVAFGKSLDAFEAQLRRMTGQDDGVVDAVFQISQPLSSASFWCPPLRSGKLDLRQLAL